MGIFTYIKLGGIALLLIGAAYITWNYEHMRAKIATQEVQIAEQKKVIQWYEKAAKIDKETQEVHNEIDKAADAGDSAKLRTLFDRLLRHQSLPKGKNNGKATDAGVD